MKKYWMLAALLLPLCTLMACGLLTPEQIESVRSGLDASLDAGHITPEQYQAAVQALEDQSQFDWNRVVDVLATLGLGMFGIRYWRGSPNARKGTAPIAVAQPTSPPIPVAG